LLRQLSRCRYGHVCMENVSASAVIERMEQVVGERGAPQADPQTFTDA
jgi:hypothetical protein